MTAIILVSMFFGGFMGTMSQKTQSYCECFRDDFKGGYCQSIKSKGEQGSCKAKP